MLRRLCNERGQGGSKPSVMRRDASQGLRQVRARSRTAKRPECGAFRRFGPPAHRHMAETAAQILAYDVLEEPRNKRNTRKRKGSA